MLTHVVIFRTRQQDVSCEILSKAKLLENIPNVKYFHAGLPVPSDRPVVDDFFTAAIVIGLNNKEDLKVYAEHPIHVDFVENCLKKFGVKVQVFDIG